jgi:sec-independent protein translocase protein TatB
VFDLSPFKILVLAFIALLVFGPDKLPGMAAQAGRALRELRRMADGAKSELRQNLGPEFAEFADLDVVDLHPKRFVRKHLMDELAGDGPLISKLADSGGNGNGSSTGNGSRLQATTLLAPGESPPYDAEAT